VRHPQPTLSALPSLLSFLLHGGEAQRPAQARGWRALDAAKLGDARASSGRAGRARGGQARARASSGKLGARGAGKAGARLGMVEHDVLPDEHPQPHPAPPRALPAMQEQSSRSSFVYTWRKRHTNAASFMKWHLHVQPRRQSWQFQDTGCIFHVELPRHVEAIKKLAEVEGHCAGQRKFSVVNRIQLRLKKSIKIVHATHFHRGQRRRDRVGHPYGPHSVPDVCKSALVKTTRRHQFPSILNPMCDYLQASGNIRLNRVMFVFNVLPHRFRLSESAKYQPLQQFISTYFQHFCEPLLQLRACGLWKPVGIGWHRLAQWGLSPDFVLLLMCSIIDETTF
jgi:hypothetical protein